MRERQSGRDDRDFLNMSNLMTGDDLVTSSESLKAGWGAPGSYTTSGFSHPAMT